MATHSSTTSVSSSPRIAGSPMREIDLTIEHRPAHAWVGGRGRPLVLVHGGWGGAQTHWSSVWNALAERFQIVAPDLPGIGDPLQAGAGSITGYARWLRALFDALSLPDAWLVGNSFGVSVIARFALDYAESTRGLVFVNGFPMPSTPPIFRWVGERRSAQRIVRAIEARVAYEPHALRRGFHDLSKVPDDIRRLVHQTDAPQITAISEALVQGGGAPGELPVAPLLLWGEDDHLPGTNARHAHELVESLPGSKLVLIPRAGHMPQVENPQAFVEGLTRFVVESEDGRASTAA